MVQYRGGKVGNIEKAMDDWREGPEAMTGTGTETFDATCKTEKPWRRQEEGHEGDSTGPAFSAEPATQADRNQPEGVGCWAGIAYESLCEKNKRSD